MVNVALIPAKKVSRRLPDKNIKLLDGKPLIAYAIEAGLKSKQVQRVIVSTDSEEIAEIAKKLGAEAPFLRPKKLAQDDTPDRPVFIHLINWLKEKENYEFDNLIFLRPTTPFKSPEMINQAIEMLEANSNLTSIRSVTKVEGVFHPYWMYKEENGIMRSFIKGIETTKYYQRQLLPNCYRLNGVIDLLRVKVILNNKNPYGDKVGFLEIDNCRAIDIDNQFDLALCEFLMKKEKNK